MNKKKLNIYMSKKRIYNKTNRKEILYAIKNFSKKEQKKFIKLFVEKRDNEYNNIRGILVNGIYISNGTDIQEH